MKKEYSFLKIASILALMLLALLIAVTSTFSWYPRTSSKTTAMYKFEYVVSGQIQGVGEKNITTYIGTLDNGHVTYEEELTSDNRTIPINDEHLYYFKTVITEVDNGGRSVISLFMDSLKCSGSTVGIGLVKPEKAYRDRNVTSGAVNNFCLEDNIIIESEGTVEIYWFVKYSGTTPLELGNFYYTEN